MGDVVSIWWSHCARTLGQRLLLVHGARRIALAKTRQRKHVQPSKLYLLKLPPTGGRYRHLVWKSSCLCDPCHAFASRHSVALQGSRSEEHTSELQSLRH